MRKAVFSGVAGLAALLMLAACASLSESQCRTGDWRGVGFSDGAAGRPAGYVANHQKACADYGIAPDIAAWSAGREQGLRQYCTPQNAYRLGRGGGSVSAVCTAAEASAMRPAFDSGRQYADLDREIRALESDRRDVAAALAALPEDAAPDRRRLRDERDRIDRRIAQLERLQRRYAVWPPAGA